MPDTKRKQAVRWILSHLACSIVSFHAGSFYGLSSCMGLNHMLPDGSLHQSFKLSGAKSIDRKSLLQTFDMGYPRNEDGADALLIKLAELKPFMPSSESASVATQDCEVIMLVQSNASSCVMVVEGLNDYHVNKWMRRKQSWSPVSRFEGTDVALKSPPKPVSSKLLDNMLQNYMAHLDKALNRLKPIVESIITKAKPLVIMVCNAGHVELLLNFVCASRKIGLDLSGYLVFATDSETETLVASWGISVVYCPGLFPKIDNAAADYGSIPYAHAMLSKVICAQIISVLGHDFVYHDVDMVPYRADYVEHFVSFAGSNDILFQYDHSEEPQYQPWSANSGFYYARSNVRTKYLFTSLLRHGDMILRSKSHQTVLSILLSEHSSLFGLKVKVLHSESDSFPVGYHFHREKEFMKLLIAGKIRPYAFHMNYNNDKKTKREFNQQLGDWYVSDTHEPISTDSCLTEPHIVCHYRDKPSKIRCDDSPLIEGTQSFW